MTSFLDQVGIFGGQVQKALLVGKVGVPLLDSRLGLNMRSCESLVQRGMAG